MTFRIENTTAACLYGCVQQAVISPLIFFFFSLPCSSHTGNEMTDSPIFVPG